MGPLLERHFPDPSKLRNVVAENLCLCDIRMYVKARKGTIIWPHYMAGMSLSSVLSNVEGVVLRASSGEEDHVFVVGLNTYRRKLEAAERRLASAVA